MYILEGEALSATDKMARCIKAVIHLLYDTKDCTCDEHVVDFKVHLLLLLRALSHYGQLVD